MKSAPGVRSHILPLGGGYLRKDPLPEQGLPVEHEVVDEPGVEGVQGDAAAQLVGLYARVDDVSAPLQDHVGGADGQEHGHWGSIQ